MSPNNDADPVFRLLVAWAEIVEGPVSEYKNGNVEDEKNVPAEDSVGDWPVSTEGLGPASMIGSRLNRRCCISGD